MEVRINVSEAFVNCMGSRESRFKSKLVGRNNIIFGAEFFQRNIDNDFVDFAYAGCETNRTVARNLSARLIFLDNGNNFGSFPDV